jgi:hypothetical protein
MPVMETEYENLRENVAPHLANLSDAQLEAVFARNGMDAEAMEGFFDSLKSFASSAGKAVLSAAPSILPVAGSIVGTAFGGPIGAQIGGSRGRRRNGPTCGRRRRRRIRWADWECGGQPARRRWGFRGGQPVNANDC